MPSRDPVAHLQRIVVRFASRVLLQDVEGAVREITANVVARNAIRSCNRTPGTGNGRSTVRTVRRRDFGLAGLADVEEPPEAMALRTDIARLNHTFAGELLLNVQVVVLHVRRLDVAVEGEDVALEAIPGGAGSGI